MDAATIIVIALIVLVPLLLVYAVSLARDAAQRFRDERKGCPDCAMKVPVDARVCRFCGYRFE